MIKIFKPQFSSSKVVFSRTFPKCLNGMQHLNLLSFEHLAHLLIFSSPLILLFPKILFQITLYSLLSFSSRYLFQAMMKVFILADLPIILALWFILEEKKVDADRASHKEHFFSLQFSPQEFQLLLGLIFFSFLLINISETTII